MLKYCFLTGLYGRKDNLMFERQGRSLAKYGFEVTLVVCDLFPDEILEGVKIVSCKWKPSGRKDRFLRSQKHLYRKAIFIDADIYQLSDPELLLLGLRLKKLGKKVIFNMREFYPAILNSKPYLPQWSSNIVSKIFSLYMRICLKHYNVVISVTYDIDEKIANWGVKNHFTITNFPIINSSFKLSKVDYLKRENALCYIGTVYKISRQENFFKVLMNIPDIKYRIAGVIEERYDEIIKNHPYWPKVNFTGRFNKEELPFIFNQATISNVTRDFYLMGTPNGSMGVIKVFESMEAALPIICSDVKLYRDIIADYNCGICVDIYNTNQIENAIKYLINNKEIAYQMGQNGRRAILEKYNWELESHKYISIINNI